MRLGELTIAVDMGRIAAKQTNNVKFVSDDQHFGNQRYFFYINQFIRDYALSLTYLSKLSINSLLTKVNK